MKTEQPILITSIEATEDIPKHRFVSVLGGLAPAFETSQTTLGICNADTKQGEQCPVMVNGIALVEASTAIVVGKPIVPSANGKAMSNTDGRFAGYALDNAVADGDIIRILLTSPYYIGQQQ